MQIANLGMVVLAAHLLKSLPSPRCSLSFSSFYRGYVFGVLCWMSSTLRGEGGAASEADKALVSSLMATLEGSLDVLLAQGYEKFTM